MNRYNPDIAPEPEEWLDLDEQERIILATDYHRRSKERLPNTRIHATIHAIVETQVALGDDTPVRDVLERLQSEGLNRHEAIHAVGRVLAEHMHGMMSGKEQSDDPNQEYFRRVEKLTAEAWRRAR